MPGPPPKRPEERTRRAAPAHEWKPSVDGATWEGRRPPCPPGVSAEAKRTWAAWFGAWWAQHWTDADVPQLRLALRAYDLAAEDPTQLPKFTPLADALGLTPKGRNVLRWLEPKPSKPGQAEHAAAAPTPGGRRLRIVDDALAG